MNLLRCSVRVIIAKWSLLSTRDSCPRGAVMFNYRTEETMCRGSVHMFVLRFNMWCGKMSKYFLVQGTGSIQECGKILPTRIVCTKNYGGRLSIAFSLLLLMYPKFKIFLSIFTIKKIFLQHYFLGSFYCFFFC